MGPWGILAAFLVAEVGVAVLVASLGAVVPPQALAEWSVRLTYGLFSSVLLVAGALAVVWSSPRRDAGLASLARLWQWPGSVPLAAGVAAGLVLKLVGIALTVLAQFVFGSVGTNNPLVLYPRAFAQPALVVLVAVAVAVVAPLAEELFFRGLLYGWLRGRLGVGLATAVAAVLFGLAHQPIVLALPLAVVGAGLCCLYERWRSLWVPAAAHLVINGSSLLVALRLH